LSGPPILDLPVSNSEKAKQTYGIIDPSHPTPTWLSFSVIGTKGNIPKNELKGPGTLDSHEKSIRHKTSTSLASAP
jgi:hypothetical protein